MKKIFIVSGIALGCVVVGVFAFIYYRNVRVITPGSAVTSSTPSAEVASTTELLASKDSLAMNLKTDICVMSNGYCEVKDGRGVIVSYAKFLGSTLGAVYSSATRDFFVAIEEKASATSSVWVNVVLIPDVPVIHDGHKLLSGVPGSFLASSTVQFWDMRWISEERKLQVEVYYPKSVSEPARIVGKNFVLKSDDRTWVLK